MWYANIDTVTACRREAGEFLNEDRLNSQHASNNGDEPVKRVRGEVESALKLKSTLRAGGLGSSHSINNGVYPRLQDFSKSETL
jgi:hypothetical protein